VWTLTNFFDKIPPSLEDAARIDGASEMTTLFRIYLPLVTPGLATVAIFSFVVSWNEYMFALVLLSKAKLQVIPAGIAGWTSTYNIDWGLISAASILTVIPVSIFFCFLGRYFVKGLSTGSVKG
jgi:ABC-type glycerol-3-phosphate transport system permease component